MDLGPMPTGDAPSKRRARLLQAWYRVVVLGDPRCGPWRPGGQVVGSTLVDGRTSGANFLSAAAWAYARERIADKAQHPELTIEEERLFNNLLSSQPLCFNFFADLRHAIRTGDPTGIQVIHALFAGEPIIADVAVTVEHLPVPLRDYLNDKTAFDASIVGTLADGRRRLITIETKYTDHLGSNIATRPGNKPALAQEIFTAEAAAQCQQQGYDQMARNLLLTHAYARRHSFAEATNYVMGLADDHEAIAAVAHARTRLKPEHQGLIAWLPLEEAVRRARTVASPELAAHVQRFERRYLDFTPIAHLLARAPRGRRAGRAAEVT